MNRDQHDGETILILGSGYSLNDFSVNDLQNYTCIGINQIARRMDPEYVTLLDSVEHMGEGAAHAFRSVLKSYCLLHKFHEDAWRKRAEPVKSKVKGMHAIDWFPESTWHEWDTNTYRKAIELWNEKGPPNGLPYGCTSAMTAVWWAAFMGASTIGLIGCDAIGPYFFESVKPHPYDHSSQHESIFHWGKCVEMLAMLLGVQLVNLSKRSVLETVPFMPFHEL